jgi:hypothetical protein
MEGPVLYAAGIIERTHGHGTELGDRRRDERIPDGGTEDGAERAAVHPLVEGNPVEAGGRFDPTTSFRSSG